MVISSGCEGKKAEGRDDQIRASRLSMEQKEWQRRYLSYRVTGVLTIRRVLYLE